MTKHKAKEPNDRHHIRSFSRAAPSPQLSNINISKSAWILLAYVETRNCHNEVLFASTVEAFDLSRSLLSRFWVGNFQFFCDILKNGIRGENNDAKYFTILGYFMTVWLMKNDTLSRVELLCIVKVLSLDNFHTSFWRFSLLLSFRSIERKIFKLKGIFGYMKANSFYLIKNFCCSLQGS